MQGLFGNDAHECEGALDTLKKFSSVLNAPVIIVSQVTKDGDYAGQMSYQHHVDCLMFLMPEETLETEGDEAERVLSVRKNRNGRAFIETRFAMTEKGLMPVEESEDDDEIC
jgi:predicted ATP-dependent serine protease